MVSIKFIFRADMSFYLLLFDLLLKSLKQGGLAGQVIDCPSGQNSTRILCGRQYATSSLTLALPTRLGGGRNVPWKPSGLP